MPKQITGIFVSHSVHLEKIGAIFLKWGVTKTLLHNACVDPCVKRRVLQTVFVCVKHKPHRDVPNVTTPNNIVAYSQFFIS